MYSKCITLHALARQIVGLEERGECHTANALENAANRTVAFEHGGDSATVSFSRSACSGLRFGLYRCWRCATDHIAITACSQVCTRQVREIGSSGNTDLNRRFACKSSKSLFQQPNFRNERTPECARLNGR